LSGSSQRTCGDQERDDQRVSHAQPPGGNVTPAAIVRVQFVIGPQLAHDDEDIAAGTSS
jgi:hypothetical protein